MKTISHKLFLLTISILFLLFSSCKINVDDKNTDLADYEVFIVQYSTTIGTAPQMRGIVKDAKFKAEWLPELSQPGYRFNGWYFENKKITAGYKMDGDMQLVASWTLIDPVKMVTVVAKDSSEIIIPKSGGAIYNAIRGQKVNPYKIGAYDITYRTWYEVSSWAKENGYTFCHEGQEGHFSSTLGQAPSMDGEYPVTQVCFYDAIIWCNAFSEKSSLTPVYYSDGDYTTIYRERTNADKNCGGVYVKSSEANNVNMDFCKANGYRLPTGAEWIWAALGGNPDGEEWKYSFSGSNDAAEVAVYAVSQMAVVGSKKSNSLGLFDMTGNARETLFCFKNDTPECYRVGGSYGVDDSSYITLNSRTWAGSDHPFNSYPWVTFRVAQSIF